MCGLTGFVGNGTRDDLVAMTTALRHRGPDGEGFFVDDETGVHLGHRRLAILDIAGGHQPMWNERDTVGVVYNGEIYNHADLRRELEQRGHTFRTDHSDTEVLVHGWEEWGDTLPERLNGMFAFAIYDRERRRIFLARDRFGEKPLYYTCRRGLFAFASELDALAAHAGCDTTLDPVAIQKLFAYGYIPAPRALYRGCNKLPAGSRLTFDVATRALRVDRYWRFAIEPDEDMGRAGEDALAEDLRERLGRAVERRLISDVPLGVFLSGGVDSSAVLALAAKHVPADALKTFTIGFREPSFDESAHARAVAATIGSDHAEQILSMDDAAGLVPDILGRLDEPLGDPSILPTYLLSAFTRQHVTVALSGDGGDELFAGYDPFKALSPARLYDRVVPGRVHGGFRHLADLLPKSQNNMSLDFKIRRALMGLSYPSALWNPVWLAPVEPSAMADLCGDPLPIEDLYEEALTVWEQSAATSLVDKTLEFYTNLYLTDDILMKVDRAAMMVSLESRAVFLDNDVVDFCRRLPHRYKYRRGERKYLLKRALAGLVPEGILGRRKKGFGIPLSSWLREIPRDPPMKPVPGVRTEWVAQCWREHRCGERDHRLLLWNWLSLQYCQSARGSAQEHRTPSS